MTKFLFAAAAATLALASPALAGERTFTKDGVTYTYTAAKDGQARVLTGTASHGGDFKLVVKNGWVRGYVGGTRVSFAAPKRDVPVTIASR